MSHSVVIRTQTVRTESTAIVINTGYLKTWSGILKFLQLALGIVCVGIIGDHFQPGYYRTTTDLFFFLIVTTFMIGTFILLLSCLTSLSTASILSKTIYELNYHCIAFGLVLSAAMSLLVQVNKTNSRNYELLLGAAICGLINSALYLLSAIISLRTYRGI